MDFKVTKREIIVSISIIAIMFLFGVLISGKISEHQRDMNEIYNKAIHIEDNADLFKHAMDTNSGNAFVHGTLETVDTVSLPEIDGTYMYLRKVEQWYERHEEWVTKKDSNGKEYKEKKVWYQWDTKHSEEWHSKYIKFCGIEFPYGTIDTPNSYSIETIKGDKQWSWYSGEMVKTRFCYYGTDVTHEGTIYAELKNGIIPNGTDFYKDMNIKDVLNRKLSGGGEIIFWFVWILLTCGCVYGFVYLENNWLE